MTTEPNEKTTVTFFLIGLSLILVGILASCGWVVAIIVLGVVMVFIAIVGGADWQDPKT